MYRRNRFNTGFILPIVLLVAAIVIVSIGIIQLSKKEAKDEIATATKEVSEPLFNQITPTSPPGQRPSGSATFPFQELTIPYLRSRKYKSELTQLLKIAENEKYTTYLTNYKSDGLNVNGLLTIPIGPVPRSSESGVGWPAIVFVHGYIVPENYRTTINYASYVDYLADNGFVVFKIDLRGHGDSEGEPGGAYYSSDYVIDTLNAYSALQNSDFVNKEKIGIWGHSMAGNIVLRAFAAKTDVPAVVIWAGAGYTYTDLQEYMIEDNSYRTPPPNSERAKKRQELRDAYGTFDPNHWFWKQVPATNYLTDLKGAIQLNHAKDDRVVSLEYSSNLNKILDETAITHELREYSAGGHNLTGSTFNEAMQNTVDFYKKHFE